MVRLCPDRQLLSVYFDGELPSPWKEKMEAHIAGCPECTRCLEEYRRISLTDIRVDADIEPSRQRLWQKLEQRAAFNTRRAAPETSFAGVWRRNISIPLPAAAAVFLFIALAFVVVFRLPGRAEPSGMILASDAEIDEPGIIPVSDMEDVLQYLSSRDNGEIIILRLPESRNFVNYGGPAIIKAADYSRQAGNQTPGRNMAGWRKP